MNLLFKTPLFKIRKIPNLDTILIDKTDRTDGEQLRDNRPENIIIHSTFKHSNLESLYNLHVNKYHWKGIGYHITISGGRAFQNREFNWEGAHAVGFNFNSIGICIYARDKIPDKEDLDIAKDIIRSLQHRYKDNYPSVKKGLPVISHTLAQTMYINRLLNQSVGGLQLSESCDIVIEDRFLKTKDLLEDISSHLPKEHESEGKYYYLKQAIKYFKNCPGEGFYGFLSGFER